MTDDDVTPEMFEGSGDGLFAGVTLFARLGELAYPPRSGRGASGFESRAGYKAHLQCAQRHDVSITGGPGSARTYGLVSACSAAW